MNGSLNFKKIVSLLLRIFYESNGSIQEHKILSDLLINNRRYLYSQLSTDLADICGKFNFNLIQSGEKFANHGPAPAQD